MKKVLIVLAVLSLFLLSSCASQVQEETPEITPAPEPPAPETFDVKIDSLTCKWSVKTGEYGSKSDCVRMVSKGTVQGPVEARLELPLLVWSTDNFDCGDWSYNAGALITVGSTCVRKEGQPEKTIWTADTGSDGCPLKEYFNNERAYSVKVYKKGELSPEKEDRKEILCQ